MQESREPKSTGQMSDKTDAAAGGKQHDDATSSETLKDIDDKEKSGTNDSEAGNSSSVPSPDGQFDETRDGGGDPSGPM